MPDKPAKRIRTRSRKRNTEKADKVEVSTIATAMAELEISYRDIDDLIDYEFNPRDNANAIESVRQSIRQFGFINPVIVDDDDIIVVGHTRRAAGRLEGVTRVPTITASHLTEKQIQAFRIVDNKVGEIATWNYELLSQEIKALEDTSDLDMTDFGFKQEQIDCLSEMVDDECLLTIAQDQGTGDGLADPTNAPTNAKESAPSTTRFVLGEFVMHLPAETYQAWARELREDCEFSPEQITAEILRRLGVEHDSTSTDEA